MIVFYEELVDDDYYDGHEGIEKFVNWEVIAPDLLKDLLIPILS